MTTLVQALNEYHSQAYLVTVAAEGPHTSHVEVTLDGHVLSFPIGKTARHNALANANVSLLWPPAESGGYSIVVNGVLTLDSATRESATVTITKSVLHRAGPATTPGGACSSDCKPLSLG